MCVGDGAGRLSRRLQATHDRRPSLRHADHTLPHAARHAVRHGRVRAAGRLGPTTQLQPGSHLSHSRPLPEDQSKATSGQYYLYSL